MNELYRELRERLAATVRFLPDKPEETPDTTLRALWHTAAARPLSPEAAQLEPLCELDEAAQRYLRELVEKRISGVPLAHITGRQRFLDMEMLAGPEALVPRKETELLARSAIDLCAQIATDRPLRVIDVCTGSGNVALAIARHVRHAQVFAADLSEAAVQLAERNAAHLGLTERCTFATGDLLEPFNNDEFLGRTDLVTCNPPYISSAKVQHMDREISTFEPHLAFDGGPFGVSILMRLLKDAPRFLRSGGWLAFEVGLGQGPAMTKHLKKAQGCSEVQPLFDQSGAIRGLAGRFTF